VRNAEIHDLEEQSTPGHKTLGTLLVPGQVQNDRVLVRLEDKVQDRRDILLGTGRWRVEQISGKGDEGRKRLFDNAVQNFTLLAEPSHRTESAAEKKIRKRDRGVPKCADHLEDDDGARADLANVATGEERLGPTK
jgi:hypothetical protein